VTKEFKKKQKAEENKDKPDEAKVTRKSAPTPVSGSGPAPLMPKLHGLSGHFHVLHQLNNPHPEVKESAKEEIDY
jgi:hypothetical protein